MDSSSSMGQYVVWGPLKLRGSSVFGSSNIFTQSWFLALLQSFCLFFSFSYSVDYSLTHSLYRSYSLCLCQCLFHTDTHKQLSVLPAPHQWCIMLLQCNNESLPRIAASGLTLTVKDFFFFSMPNYETDIWRFFSYAESLNGWRNGENSR